MTAPVEIAEELICMLGALASADDTEAGVAEFVARIDATIEDGTGPEVLTLLEDYRAIVAVAKTAVESRMEFLARSTSPAT